MIISGGAGTTLPEVVVVVVGTAAPDAVAVGAAQVLGQHLQLVGRAEGGRVRLLRRRLAGRLAALLGTARHGRPEPRLGGRLDTLPAGQSSRQSPV